MEGFSLLITCWQIAVTVIILSGIIAIFTAPSKDLRRMIYQHMQVIGVTSYWKRFQREIIAELQTAPPLPFPPAGGPDGNSAVPPRYLFYGTQVDNFAKISVRGIEGRSAGRVFFTDDETTAGTLCLPFGKDYVIFRILSNKAYQDGLRFNIQHGYYTADYIHPIYLDTAWTLAELYERHK